MNASATETRVIEAGLKVELLQIAAQHPRRRVNAPVFVKAKMLSTSTLPNTMAQSTYKNTTYKATMA